MNAPRDTQPAAAPPASARLPSANHRIRLPDFELGGALTVEQRDFLDTHGFIRFRGFAERRVVRSLVEEVEAIDRRLVGEGRTHINGVRSSGSQGTERLDVRYRVYERPLGGNR
ncbi:hypothetical protein [Sorangium sp. So ce1000]|uniref:hypothetical protein n=1 Tax=Sorangium sp. So ce1000 TaxID=3133325 RepID=UPI003F6167D9